MTLPRRSLFFALLPAAALVIGCASPGVPRAPSLQLPEPARNLTALRRGNTVELQFIVRRNNTDNIPLRSSTVTATLCRSVDSGPCKPVAGSHNVPFPSTASATVSDPLPPELTTGSPHLLMYKVQLANDRGRAAAYSEPGYTVSGAPLPEVADLRAQGSRLGVVLSWQPAGGDAGKVVLRREDLNPSPPAKQAATPKAPARTSKPSAPGRTTSSEEPNVVWLDASGDSGAESANSTLDDSALTDEPYRYSAERRRTLELSGHLVEMRSDVSAPVLFSLRDVFPPKAPVGINIAAFGGPQESTPYAVDLIWQPVEDPQLAGYNIYREPVDTSGSVSGPRVKLNRAQVREPAFHDSTATPSQRYRYEITAVDAKGNESSPGIANLDPTAP